MFSFINKERLEEEYADEPDKSGDLNKFKITPRHLITAPQGKSLVSIDYKNQELFFIAVLSEDENMIYPFEAEEKVYKRDDKGHIINDEEGNPISYKNPYADLHTVTTAECCFPYLFEGQPLDKWDSIARDPNTIKLLGDPRVYGKKTNFGIVYLQTPETMAEQNYLPVEQCQTWRDNHELQFPEAHRYISEQEDWANTRGWARNALGRLRWVREDNAKMKGASPGRSGVNHLIQSLGAELAKMAIVRLEKLFRGTPARLIGLIHDEVLVEVPGQCSLNNNLVDQSEPIEPEYTPDEEAKSWAETARLELERAQTHLFDTILREEQKGRFKGKAEADISAFWSH